MHKVSRSLLLAGVLAFGTLTAACGDKVTVAGVQPGVTGVQSVTVSPSPATVTVGQSIQLAVSVVADATTAKTVTWASSNSAIASVDQTGKVTGVAAGAVTVTATSTADASKASAVAVTVTGPSVTPAAIAISAINQGNVPVVLNNVFGQVDVVLFVSGPSGTINLINQCTNGPTTTDVIVASQAFAGAQNQTPVTLSYNTAATGTVVAGVAKPDNTSTTPIFLNGNCIVKASLLSGATVLATANNTIPITLNNASFYRTLMSNTGSSAISGNNGLNYISGDVTFTLTPVNYVSSTPLASISGNFAGFPFVQVAPAAGTQTFTVTFGSAIVTSGTVPPLSNYTSGSAGDNLQVTSSVTTGGQNGFTGPAVTFGPVRVDNGVPSAPPASTNNQTGAQINNATNWVNGTYSFAAGVNTPTDAGSPATGVNTIVQVIGYAPSTAFATLTGNGLYGLVATQGIGATQCSQTGWTIVTTGSTIPQSPAGVSTQYRARSFWTDKLNNIRCQDLVGTTGSIATPIVPANANGFFGVDLQNPNALVQTAGPTGGLTTNTPAQNAVLTKGKIVTNTTIIFSFQDSISGFVLNHQMNYSVFRNFTQTTASGTSGCSPINDTFNPVFTGGTTANGCSNAANNGPTLNIDNGSNVEAYYTVIAKSVDQAGNASPAVTQVYLLDNTAPVVQGISIPQNLTGATSQSFTSTATDNVDLALSNFNITYSPATAYAGVGGANLFYAGDNYGPNYDATLVKSAAVNATVPFFIKQLQATDVTGAPVALTAADSGEASNIAVRAIDANNNISAVSAAAIPNINISSSAGFTGGTQFNTFTVTNAAVNISNGTGTTNPKTIALTAGAVLLSATAQNAPLPFAQVCYFYQQTAAGFAADPTIPAGALVQIGCITAPSITDVAGVSRTWTYTSAAFDPPTALGTAGTINIFAVGINAAGVGVLTQANANITLTN